MTEAALFYETTRSGFGDLFLDDVRRAIDTIRERPEIGANIAYGFPSRPGSPIPLQHHLLGRRRRSDRRSRSASASTPELLDQAHMTANNAFERTQIQRGRIVLAMDCALADAQWRSWPAAQLGR